jgi:hypothetical protein
MIHLSGTGFLFIAAENWNVPERQREFLQSLLDLFDCLQEFGGAKLAWCQEMDQLLWGAPQVPPWRMDLCSKNAMIPVIYRRLQQCTEYYNLSSNVCAHFTENQCLGDATRPDADEVFGRLAHEVIFEEEITTTVAVSSGALQPGMTLVASCECHGAREIAILRSRRDWIMAYRFIERLWPVQRDDASSAKLTRCIQYFVESSDEGNFRRQFVFQPSYANRFLEDVGGAQGDAVAILEALARRLTMQTHETTAHAALGDELLKGSDTVRRLRVSGAARIHYEVNDQRILFTRYYSASQHDDGI